MIKYGFTATIKVTSRKGLADCLKQDILQKDRSKLTITETDGDTVIEITATDAVALRATLNGITQMLTVHEKMQAIQ